MPINGNGINQPAPAKPHLKPSEIADMDRDAFIAELQAQRAEKLPDPPKPPPPTARQRSQTELELEAGRKRVKYFQTQQELALAAKMRADADAAKHSAPPVVETPGHYQHERNATKVKGQTI